MINVRKQRFARLRLSVSSNELLARLGVILLLGTAGLLAGIFLSTNHQLPSQLLQTDEFQKLQEWLKEKKRINEHIVKVCEKYGETAREMFKRKTGIDALYVSNRVVSDNLQNENGVTKSDLLTD